MEEFHLFKSSTLYYTRRMNFMYPKNCFVTLITQFLKTFDHDDPRSK